VRKPKPFLIVENIQEVVSNKMKRNQYTFRIEPTGESYFIVDGRKVSEEYFNQMFPIELRPYRPKGANSDRRNNWMHGDKCY
jgi:hypothetical protein